jgi:hypothetical protein
MKPATPRTTPVPTNPSDIHSGTGDGPTPGDDRGPASPASAVRNPQPLPADIAPMSRPALPDAEDDSPDGQGYWQHDSAGPRAYVPPMLGETPPPDDTLREIGEALSLLVGTLPDPGDQSIHLRRINGQLHLVGLVTSDVVRRAAHRCVQSLTAEPVVDDLALR